MTGGPVPEQIRAQTIEQRLARLEAWAHRIDAALEALALDLCRNLVCYRHSN